MKEDFEKELNELSPFLADLKKQQKNEPFKTPRLYFDTLADKVLEKAKEEKNTAVVPPQYNQPLGISNRINGWLSTIFQPRLALSGLGLALVIVAGWFIVNQQKTTAVTSNEPTFSVSEPVKNNSVDAPLSNNTSAATTENAAKQSSTIEPKMPNIEEKKSEIAVNETIPTPPATAKPAAITHPKSGLTEEEIEEYLKDALSDEDIENIGGK